MLGDPFIIQGTATDLQITMRDWYGREWNAPVLIDTILPPDTVWVVADERSLDINWTWTDTTSNLAGYNVYRSLNPSGIYERINPLLITGVSYYRDTGLEDWTEYYYKITAVDTLGNESEFSDIAYQRTQPPFQQGFPASVEVGAGSYGFYLSSSTVADIDNDNRQEIAIGAQGRVYVFDDNGSTMNGWPVLIDSNYWICSSPAVADLNGDSALEIVISTGYWKGATDSMVHCFDMYGNEMPGWPVYVGSPVFTSPVIADIDGDGQNEILVATMSPSRLYAFEATGDVIPGFPVDAQAGEFYAQSPSVADFDIDGKDEIFILSRGTQTSLLLVEYNSTFNKIDTMPGWPVVLGADELIWTTHSAICDVDANGSPNIVVVSRNPPSVRCYETDGELAWQYGGSSATQIGGPGLGDINNDGLIDIIYTFGDEVFAVGGNGNLLWRKALPIMGGDWARCSQGIVVADIDGDMLSEVLLSSFNWLWILNHDGTMMKGAPFKLEGEGQSTPAVADIDDDNHIEIICASGGDCKLKVWDMPYQISKIEWPMFQHDIKHTGRYYAPIRGYVKINDGADTTHSRYVTLTLNASSDYGSIDSMRLWDEKDTTAWLPYDTVTTWTLYEYDGKRRVYVEFKDATEQTCKASDDIYKLTVDAVTLVNDDKYLTNFRLGLLGFSVTGYEGAVDSIRLLENGDTTGWLQRLDDTLVFTFSSAAGKVNIGAQFKDNVGNISIAYLDTVLFDPLFPMGSIRTPFATNVYEIACTLSAADNLSGVDSFRLSNLPLDNIVPNGDFCDTSEWVCENTTIHDGYAELLGGFAPGGGQIGSNMYSILDSAEFEYGTTYRLSAELITYKVIAVWIALFGHLSAGYDTTIMMFYVPNGNHIYPGSMPIADTFTIGTSQAFDYYKLMVGVPEIVIPPWPPPETLSATVYLNNIAIVPVAPESLYGPWIAYDQDTVVSWQLLAGEGEKVIYAQFADSCGNICQAMDTTIVETTPPTGTVIIDKDVNTTNSSYVVLDPDAENGQSGVDKMQVSNYPSYNPIMNAGFDQGSADWVQHVYKAVVTFANGVVTLSAPGPGSNGGNCDITQRISAGFFAGQEDSTYIVSLYYKKTQPDSSGVSISLY